MPVPELVYVTASLSSDGLGNARIYNTLSFPNLSFPKNIQRTVWSGEPSALFPEWEMKDLIYQLRLARVTPSLYWICMGVLTSCDVVLVSNDVMLRHLADEMLSRGFMWDASKAPKGMRSDLWRAVLDSLNTTKRANERDRVEKLRKALHEGWIKE